VRVLGASVDLELGALLAAKGGLGQHALDGVLDTRSGCFSMASLKDSVLRPPSQPE
jgi:hypothetical protein